MKTHHSATTHTVQAPAQALATTTPATLQQVVPTQNVYDLSHRFSPEQTYVLLFIAVILGALGLILTHAPDLRTAKSRVWG